ncbi:MAG: lytic transglycosylase domain-containing protein [Opitutus sp.]|nr:lytic transglycosylase domain-containing protein [Opitutus sp.]
MRAAEAAELFEAGRLLFEQLASPEIKAQFQFPTKEQWDEFSRRFQRALEGDSLEELAAYAPEARTALTALRTVPGYEDLADWLEQRIDEIEAAQQAIPPRAPVPPPVPKMPTRPGTPRPVLPAVQPVPHYNLWLARVRDRPLPVRATALMPKLRAVFVAEGVPPELAWLAEAESSLNPGARSPAGAKGLFQFMPDTARAMGLSPFLPDDRTDPEKSARAAARYLRALHGKFGNWALALAAYNAGEGRVSRTLTKQGATSFTAIADALPAETRMYVPKVCALIATRAGVAPHQIAPPRK